MQDDPPVSQTTDEKLPAYMSRNPRPGFVICRDPKCHVTFGHPHYHEHDEVVQRRFDSE